VEPGDFAPNRTAERKGRKEHAKDAKEFRKDFFCVLCEPLRPLRSAVELIFTKRALAKNSRSC
jgi:hypothetical protein